MATAILSLTGDKALDRKLKRLMGPEILKITRASANKAMTPVRAAARKRVQKKSKNTMKAIVKKTVTYKSAGNVLVMVGVRRSTLKTRRQGVAASNLEHILERGHDIVVGGPKKKGGKVIGFVRPFPFMGPAWRQNKEKMQTIYAKGMENGIHKLAKREGFKA